MWRAGPGLKGETDPDTIDARPGIPLPATYPFGDTLVKRLARFAKSAGLVSAGVVLGVAATSPLGLVTAQDTPSASAPIVATDVSEANAEKIKLATDALSTAQVALEQDLAYKPAVTGLNAYAVLAAGVDAVEDLENGRGVDPITFAGLYSGLEIDEVTPHLKTDSNGRLTYKGKLVRMYPPERMKELVAKREAILTLTAGNRRIGVEE